MVDTLAMSGRGAIQCAQAFEASSMSKSLSQRAGFKDGVLIGSTYNCNPASSGEMELGIRWLKTKMEVWSWVDEGGADRLAAFPVNTSAGELIKALQDDERVPFDIDNTTIINDRPPYGFAFCALTSADETLRQGLLILAAQPNETLLQLSKKTDGLCDNELLDTCSKLVGVADDAGVNLEHMDVRVMERFKTVDEFCSLLRNKLAKAIRAARRMDREESAKLGPHQEKIKQILDAWLENKPKGRWPGSYSTIPPLNFPLLSKFLTNYVLRHGEIPKGMHLIPGGLGLFGKEVGPFYVDFDNPGVEPSK